MVSDPKNKETNPQDDAHQLIQQILRKFDDLETDLNHIAALTSRNVISRNPSAEIPQPRADEVVDIYSSEAAQILEAVYPQLVANRQKIAKYFYSNLGHEAEKILNLLTSKEFSNLHIKQQNYLQSICAPQLSLKKQKDMATVAGKRHELISLPPEILVSGYKVYRQAMFHAVPELQHCEDLSLANYILEQRLQNDMAWQLIGYLQSSQERNLVLHQLNEAVKSATNRDDLLETLLQQLRQMPAIAGVSIGSFTNNNQLICEKSLGLVLHQSECLFNAQKAFTDEPLVRAWRTEKPQWINSVSLEVGETCIRDNAEHLGIRSYGVIPLVDTKHNAPLMLLVIYSHMPSFFLAETKQFFFAQVAQNILPLLLSKLNQSRHLEKSLYRPLEIRQLLEKDSVEMHFQPIVNASTGEIYKFEALARLKDGDDNIIPPYYFLEALGSVQLVYLFELAFKKSCQFLLELHKNDYKRVGVSINLPTEAFAFPKVFQHIYEVVHELDIKPHYITLEVLETNIIDQESSQTFIHTLKKKGFRVALDDVGTGESSISRIKSLPIDEIKIDQEFVRPLVKDLENADYLESLIRLARNLNKYAIIEGVEDQNIIDIVRTFSGDYMQGYGIAKPMPHKQALQWAERYTRENKQKNPQHIFTQYLPQTIFGWYARHLQRAKLLMDALPRHVDLIDFHIASHAENCPMTQELDKLAIAEDLKKELHTTHHAFHETIGQIEKIVKSGQLELYHAFELQLMQVVAHLRLIISKNQQDLSE